MFKKLIDLLSDSKIEFPELAQEIHVLQQSLKENVQRRKDRMEKERCHIMHEMKNSLTGMLSCAQVLNDENIEHEDRQEFLLLIGREIDRLVGMAEEFSESCDETAYILYVQDFSVELFFDTLIPLLEKYTLADRNIELSVDAGYTGPIRVDLDKIQRAFLNIIHNARDAMPDGGSLTISSRLLDDETLLLEFIDSGCGMSPDMQERMFEPFATEGKPLGTGLGMAIVKEIVDEHQGNVEVKSVLGEGTTVQISLPVSQ